ncbi:hypothetical protein [Rhodococcus aetherivorans]|uniref:hypothetical protein n=1 Tax=Rhodococcus aetherivorans TaxID=191292 RepID=UPI0021AE1921|nr:hypothetical protein [Rhodococcus aetherivorans]
MHQAKYFPVLRAPLPRGQHRAQFAFFRQLSAEAGYTLDTDRFTAARKNEPHREPLVGDLREQFVWGRFEYMQTGDTRLMREVLDIAITDTDPTPVGPIIERGVDLRALAAAPLGHPRSPHAMVEGAPSPADPTNTVVTELGRTHQEGCGLSF